MPRRRLGVVLLLPTAVAVEVDGLRRACGDPALDRIPPHVTLVPPVNVRQEDVDDALAVVRRAAGAVDGPLRLGLGPVDTFLPDSPVLRLDVGGPDGPLLHDLRAALLVGPLERQMTWPFVPHVTLCDGGEEERLRAGVVALAGWSAAVSVERVHVLEQGDDRVWRAIADAPFGGGRTVGRGGIAVDLVSGPTLDQRAVAALGPDLVGVVARRDGRVVGHAVGRMEDDAVVLVWLAVEPEHRDLGIGRRLVDELSSVVERRRGA